MAGRNFYREAWNAFHPYTRADYDSEDKDEQGEPKIICPAGKSFTQWAERYCQPLIDQGTEESLNQAKIRLFNQYWQERRSLAASHSSVVHLGLNLRCIPAVWVDYSLRIMSAELTAAPKAYHLPPPPPKPKRVKREPDVPDYVTIGERITAGK